MPSRSELESDLQIAEAENEELSKQVHNLQAELDRIRGAANAAGVSLAISAPGEESKEELVALRGSINDDLQAISELHNPPPREGKVETSLDVVRANNRERAELQTRLTAANGIVGRVAAALGIDRWDPEGTEIIERLQRVSVFRVKLKNQLALRKKNYQALRLDRDAGEKAATAGGEVAALEWMIATWNEIRHRRNLHEVPFPNCSD